MHFLLILTIAVSLSMDAFSLSLAYGTLGLSKQEMVKLSSIVGVYHFFMPLLGLNFGKLFLHLIPLDPDIIVFVVLFFVGMEMIIETLKKETVTKKNSFIELLAFGLAVSIDSFSVGIGLNSISGHYIICSLIFSLSSFLFTFTGLKLGKKINQIIGKISTVAGGITLIILGMIYLL